MAKHGKSQSGPDPFYQILESLMKGIWYVISLPFKGLGGGKAKQAELEKIRSQFRASWSTLEASLHDPVHRHQAIMQADILLDRALQFRNVSGTTLGERLKAAQTLLSREVLDVAWRAHKVRNRLAHELHAQVSEKEAEQTFADFRRVLKELGVL
jgi:hypothetical protein